MCGLYHFLECIYAFRQYRYGIVPYVMRKCTVGLDRLFKWHKMPAERVALCWLHALLMPRRLVFKGSNIHANEIEQLCTAARAVELNEMKNRREKGKDALEKDLEGRGAVSTGKHENSAQHAGDDPGQAHSE